VPSPLTLLAGPALTQVRRWVLTAFPRDPKSGIDYDHPQGDPGLFGPDSVTWKINADFPGMLSGGLSALMLQTLHPQALAGVWDHSNFRTDLIGRLRRTTAFVGGTTYAPHADAEALIARVKHIHARVRGTTGYGLAYSADDPALLTWVHVTEVYSFLQGYRRYCRALLPPGAADRYYDETRRIAEALGARDVPCSEAEVTAYFAHVARQLRFDERSRIVLEVLSRIRLPVPMAGFSRELFVGAGAALLPPWAIDLLQRSPRQQAQARLAAHTLRAMAPLFRAALSEGVAARSCRRVGVSPDILHRWQAPG
jgi:uncharacterized protein (DUF2236 family)